LRQSWHDQAKDQGIDAKDIEQTLSAVRQRAATQLGGQTRDGVASDPALAAVKQGIAHLSETSVSFGKDALVEASLRFGKNVDFAQVSKAVSALTKAKELLPAGKPDRNNPQLTTQDLILTEKQIVQEWRASKAGTSLMEGGMIRGRLRSAGGHVRTEGQRGHEPF
jgi:hypothetical protein